MTLEDIQTKIDPENIFLMGDSSSGNTAFITAFTADMNCMDTDVYKEYSCKVNAVVDLYGVSCVKIKEDFPTTPNQGEPDSPEGLEIGSKNVYEHPELSDQITCMNYVKKELPSPPVLMMHGTADDTVAPNQSIQLYKKLKEEEKEELSKNLNLITSFKELALKRGVKLIDENFSYIRTIGIVASYPNIVEYLCQDVKRDKEGLYNFSQLCSNYERKAIAEGLLYSKDFILMVHPHFRRSYFDKNNFAPRFVELFWKESFNDIEPSIALDCNRVRIDVNDRLYKEFDTWYGAKFSENIELIPDGIVHLRPPLDLDNSFVSLFFNNTYSLDIKWSTKGKIKTFQSEEFKTEDVFILHNRNIVYPVRYVHAEFDLDTKKFRHFDGAIHYYTAEEYYGRRDSDFNYNTKESNQIKSQSEKLFKMNGVVDVETWIKFTSHFMTGNPLIFEYFEGKYPENIEEIICKMRNKNE